MTEIEVPITSRTPWEVLSEILERCFTAEGLTITMRGTLASYRGSIHWHLKHPGCPGTLEATLWTPKRRVWFSIHDNRRADWMDRTVERLRAAIGREAGSE